ncbi:MAG TPA: hypothetical protein PKD99_06435 [Sphingopyxis sp.]|nr:hypothetical protein [Sphingopyxis sp.]HMP44726.1 hypothetical protein [Sphingopyxis sp.]
MIAEIEKGAAPVSVAEAKAWLRLGAGRDDAVVAGLIRTAAELCEAFTGQMLIARSVTEEVPVSRGWLRLAKRPVIAVETVAAMIGGEAAVLDAGDWRAEIDRDGAARLRAEAPGDAARLRIVYRAGLAEEANGLPEAIRQGLARMIQHLHEARDAPGHAPPAIIAALWQPWRSVGIGR